MSDVRDYLSICVSLVAVFLAMFCFHSAGVPPADDLVNHWDRLRSKTFSLNDAQVALFHVQRLMMKCTSHQQILNKYFYTNKLYKSHSEPFQTFRLSDLIVVNFLLHAAVNEVNEKKRLY